ncbi:molybdate ABC transporter substrate-binding protein [Gulosibacter molinativorax]|uniref:Molybdate ABC transporter substrate-binding protein n=1 Tax=Gulosibacter molinativorax TaxID=256821 RepID=A0ABT7CAY3_9MICO|nr:molybdate ABC transporter substrate-binding protein [Gulosibacter molinativorax]MDJ1372350.1 molybdate ABC transporter substrate-binding protein [Gulosibacter molinativorax]QUY63560.1 Molybdate ABC transporter, substrate-binding protein ModA [Gulosibacter molinativorax]
MMKRLRTGLVLLAGAALLFGTSGCAANGGATPDESAGDATTANAEPLNILAAASLTQAFETIIEDFSAAHPDIEIAPLVTGGSQDLVQQVIEGAPADVLALASEPSAEPLAEAGVETDFSVFAENTLVIAVQPGNPKDIQGLDDLANNPDLKIAICAVEVPCGAATQKLLELNGLEITGATEETNVSAVLAKAELDEVDAAIVYQSDLVTSSADLEGIEPEQAAEVVNRYPITTLGENPNAAVFVEYVRSDAGSAVLEEAGLVIP